MFKKLRGWRVYIKEEHKPGLHFSIAQTNDYQIPHDLSRMLYLGMNTGH